MWDYQDVFVEKGKKLGMTTLLQHQIDTGTHAPIKIPGRRIPPHQKPEVDVMLDELISQDIIRPSFSPWSAPILVVKKKDGSLRCCVDFRKLNEITVKDAYPIPRIDESIDALCGSYYFTVLDLKSGYFQLPLEEESKSRTAFSTHRGLYEFNVLPMGVTNGPAIFARLMNNVLAGLTWQCCLVYLDDTIVIGRNFRQTCGQSPSRSGMIPWSQSATQSEEMRMVPVQSKIFGPCRFSRRCTHRSGHHKKNNGLANAEIAETNTQLHRPLQLLQKIHSGFCENSRTSAPPHGEKREIPVDDRMPNGLRGSATQT